MLRIYTLSDVTDFNTYTYHLVTKYQMELRCNLCLRVQGASKFSEQTAEVRATSENKKRTLHKALL